MCIRDSFLFGIPQWCVSVAVHDDDGALAGVVYDPLRDEIYCGERGGVATLNGTPVEGSGCADLASSLIGTGFGYESSVRSAQAAVVARVLPQVRDVRRMGSAALDLAWTAAGRYDGFYERGVQAWDIAAGSLLCACSGLVVRELVAAGAVPSGIVVAPPGLIDELQALVS